MTGLSSYIPDLSLIATECREEARKGNHPWNSISQRCSVVFLSTDIQYKHSRSNFVILLQKIRMIGVMTWCCFAFEAAVLSLFVVPAPRRRKPRCPRTPFEQHNKRYKMTHFYSKKITLVLQKARVVRHRALPHIPSIWFPPPGCAGTAG